MAQIVIETQQKRHKGVTSNRFFCGRKKGYKMKKGLLLLILIVSAPCFLKAQASVEQDTAKVPAQLYFKEGKLHFQSKDERFHLWLDNRIYIDYSYYFPTTDIDDLTSDPNKDLEEDDGKFRFNNGVSVRRARFALKAEMWKNWFAEFDIDFAYNEVEIKDMYLGYKFSDHVSVQAGHFKEPMSMERLTSSRYLSSNERPMPVEMFAGGRRLGLAVTAWGEHWWASGGVFGQQIDIIQKERNRGSDGFGFTGRVAFSPINTGESTIHVGGYATWRKPDAAGEEDRLVEFRSFPESRTDRRRFVRAEIPNVNHYATYGVELGGKWRDLLVHGEYIFTSLSRYRRNGDAKMDLKNAEFVGWYASVSYMLRGGQRLYSPEDAEFGPMERVAKGGNLEVVGRVSHVNLNDFHEASSVITGGSAYAYSFNLNWYPVRNILFGLNYTFMDNDKYADDKGNILKGGLPLSEALPDGLDFHICQLRMMISF